MDVKVNENRSIIVSGVGQIIGENNATVLNFSFPNEIVGIDIEKLNKYIVFDIGENNIQPIENNQFALSSLYTQSTELVMQVLIKKGKSLLFESEKFLLEFQDNIEVHYETTINDLDIIDNLITQYQEIVTQVIEFKNSIINLEKEIKDAENLRLIAENGRIENDKNRQKEFDDLKNKMSEAIKDIGKVIDNNVLEKFNNMKFSINKGNLEVILND